MAGIVVSNVNPVGTRSTWPTYKSADQRVKDRFVCDTWDLGTHNDVNASRNLTRISRSAV
ncbi:hypothetical protein MPNT_10430 [Candidatus Methylacidithermus pantelleriae]|uniref:Uncharacterized protein n=1 Tax=Candidatus Methylacidithermus pantelleriae TaxID=2744239 RepID=A0A8J2BML2_9BACT|nr:hypothetical protein MPNT_10430 [Candidatus Methylacidithermus pantelleriae]